MRHPRQVGDHRRAADLLAERQGQPAGMLLPVLGGEDLAEEHGLALGVRHLDADHVAARHGGDADGGDGQAAGDVVGQADHPGAADAGRRLQLVERDHRAGADLDDAALHAVIRQHGLEQPRVGLQRLGTGSGRGAGGRRLQQREGREPPCAVGQRQRLLLRLRPARDRRRLEARDRRRPLVRGRRGARHRHDGARLGPHDARGRGRLVRLFVRPAEPRQAAEQLPQRSDRRAGAGAEPGQHPGRAEPARGGVARDRGRATPGRPPLARGQPERQQDETLSPAQLR